MIACCDANTDEVKKYIESDKIQVNYQDSEGRSGLWIAAFNDLKEVAKLLLKSPKIDVNLKDNYGRTPLWIAFHNNSYDTLKLLLEDGRLSKNLTDILDHNKNFPTKYALNFKLCLTQMLDIFKLIDFESLK